MQAVTNPVFLSVIAVLVLAWRLGSVMESWHQDNLQRKAKADQNAS